MLRVCTATALFITLFFFPSLHARQDSTRESLTAAAVAWDRGDYVAALTTYQQLLDSPAAADALEAIALQTGELYVSTELTTDGAVPQFSPDGRLLTYETGAPGARRIRILRADATTTAIAELEGSGAAFSPDAGRLAYLRAAPPAQGAVTLVVRDLASGAERVVDTPGLAPTAVLFAGDGSLLVAAAKEGDAQQVYRVAAGAAPVALTQGAGDKLPAGLNAPGDALLFATRTPPADGRGGRGALPYSLSTLPSGTAAALDTTDRPSFSADGKWLAFVTREGDTYRLVTRATAGDTAPATLREGPERMENPALSADGSRVAYELMTDHDWEIYTSPRAGGPATRVTREIQHDLLPQFLSNDRLLGVIGEPRHRRSYLYDLTTGTRTRLFHNNTVRTIAPEYSWTPSPDGTKVLIVAERDGNTVSPDRGVYLMDLTKKVTREDVRARVAASLQAERALRAKADRLYAPIATAVKAVVSDAAVPRVYGYEKALFDFDSKHISQPGNRLASTYLAETYTSFGYEPELQWFEPRGALDGRTANVVATLRGTVNPELVYVISSHYDSVAGGPGADDDSSGTAALLETARLMAKHPQPATIVFASFTGEEAGLLGSREFVRRAVADQVHVVGALNNDMIGWANDYRLDNTIRYSNEGIRDVQHAAAMLFTNLITYDALYYKGTDAAAYYEAYGDIVGGIGSYPVLGNPHYHQPHDLLETINHTLVTEVAKTNVATLMLLASSPSRLTNLKVDDFSSGRAAISWTASPEKQITGYLVSYGTPGGATTNVRTTRPSVTLTGVAPGTVVLVKAVNAKGLEGWDWAHVTVR